MLMLPAVNEDARLNRVPVLYWNHVGLEMNRVVHSLDGPLTGPTMSSRALGLLHLAMHDAYFGALGQNSPYPTYLTMLPATVDPAWGPAEAEHALAGAATKVLDALYARKASAISDATHETLVVMMRGLIGAYPGEINTLHSAYVFGEMIGVTIIGKLGVKPGEPGADAGYYRPSKGRYKFREDPVHPVRRAALDPEHPERGSKPVRAYHGPHYGDVQAFAVHHPQDHVLAPPPRGEQAYIDALREVVALGGAPGTPHLTRKPDQTVAAFFWAYDGANLIGSPPRLYNQIVRKLYQDGVAGNLTHEQLIRLFALINVAMADAGKFAWKEKYKWELWRPQTGIREHDTGSGPGAIGGMVTIDSDADPFWTALGAPDTNTNRQAFKPPFPAYPSGHATFGSACFQMVRLFVGKAGNKKDGQGIDDLAFDFVSDEMNGVSRDLDGPYDPSAPLSDQPGTVRTRVVRKFASLWDAIFENGISRVYLGVHWNFDAFDPANVPAEGPRYGRPAVLNYSNVWPNRAEGLPVGGIPLGLGIANDIWDSGLREPPAVQNITVDVSQSIALNMTPTPAR
ncbi:vanadium-dependent haloperoxidase [Affinirhizobium pseudoryzae]|uniref:vanadium-dependent haloperoxidase n=1 Tax=Allorhizobium pseudoryzae TaxID=379684 RepID=UPI0013EC3862|nr:vanadium-dependent haloperoxidase [Allorhizobium pseudoryzae]